MTVLQFALCFLGICIFAWLHPDVASMLFLIVLTRWIWKWSA